uniref:Uncharacterized protein n=1 Tax=Romanomermis culicivorax TaxID=13658 RepID=A0A915IL07_ROMCU
MGQVVAKRLDREARELCKLGNKRPLEAHTNMNTELNRLIANDDEHQEIEQNLPEYKTMKSGLKRWFQKGRIPVADAYDLPVEYSSEGLYKIMIHS